MFPIRLLSFRSTALVRGRPGLLLLLIGLCAGPAPAQVLVVGGSAGSVPQLAFRQAEISRTWNAGSFTQPATVAGSKGAVIYSSSNPTVATVHAVTGVVTPLRQGQATITAVQAPQGYFPSAQASYALRLTAAAAVLQPWTLPPVSLVSGPLPLTPPGSNSPGAFSFSSSDPAVASISGQQLTVHRSGETIITATQAATDDYSAASTTARLVVSLQAPTIGAWSLPTDLVYGGAPRTLVPPVSDSAAPFTYSSSNPQVVQISGNQLQLVGAGTAVITATQPALGAYAGGSVSASLTVARSTPVLNTPTGASLLESRWQSADIPMIFGLTSAAMGLAGGSWTAVDGDRVQSLSTSFDGNLVVRTRNPGAFTLRYTVPETANTLGASRDVSFLAYANQPFQLLDVTAIRPDSLPDGTVIGSVSGVSVSPFSTTVSLHVCADRSTTYRFRFAVPNNEAFGVGWTDPVGTTLVPSGGEVVVDLALGGNPGDLATPRSLRVRQLGSADGLYRDVTRSVTLQVAPIQCPSAPV